MNITKNNKIILLFIFILFLIILMVFINNSETFSVGRIFDKRRRRQRLRGQKKLLSESKGEREVSLLDGSTIMGRALKRLNPFEHRNSSYTKRKKTIRDRVLINKNLDARGLDGSLKSLEIRRLEREASNKMEEIARLESKLGNRNLSNNKKKKIEQEIDSLSNEVNVALSGIERESRESVTKYKPTINKLKTFNNLQAYEQKLNNESDYVESVQLREFRDGLKQGYGGYGPSGYGETLIGLENPFVKQLQNSLSKKAQREREIEISELERNAKRYFGESKDKIEDIDLDIEIYEEELSNPNLTEEERGGIKDYLSQLVQERRMIMINAQKKRDNFKIQMEELKEGIK